MKTSLALFSCLVLGCSGGRAARTADQADRPLPPTATTLTDTGEAFAEDTAPLGIGDGRAQVALVGRPGAHGPVAVRALVDGKRVELFSATTGDCGGGTIAELRERDGAAIVVLGQSSYTDCDDDNEGVAGADIDSHVECARVAWSPAAGTVEVERSQQVGSEDELPAWCQPAPAVAATGDDVCCDTEVDGPEWHHRTECDVNDWPVLPAARCPQP